MHASFLFNQRHPICGEFREKVRNLLEQVHLSFFHDIVEAIATEEDIVPVGLAVLLFAVVPDLVASAALAVLLLLLNFVNRTFLVHLI